MLALISALLVPVMAVVTDEAPLPLIPKPKVAKLDYEHPVELTGAYSFPVGRVRFWSDFTQTLAYRYRLPKATAKTVKVAFDAGVSKLDKRAGGYEITIRPGGRISVLGEEDEGLRNGLRRLAMMAYVKDGRLLLPSGTLTDEPEITWRGVHLFVGPGARPFQRRLWQRVLLPLGMNKVVLQCERTQWETTPIDASQNPMAREELAALFEDYRKLGVEPIPLIQSIGHMGWFFAGSDRKDLAVNPQEPFTLDYRKPEAIQAIRRLWVEATTLLKPSVIHFGGDEITLRGFPKDSPGLDTEIWQKAMPELKAIADSGKAKMMIWGDMGLAAGEAVDATNAADRATAQVRRQAIPKGTWIGDWHYKDDSRPELFYPSLQLWKREGFRPVASGWFRPQNVRGYALAAVLERVGYLQTTWAGYESNAASMDKNLPQFAAMVEAADYTWSGRQEPVEKLGYVPEEIFRRLYYAEPRLVSRVQ